MRLATDIERLYLDFDGFFASVEQQAHPRLRGRPIGVIPFEGTERTCVIACSREAKARGVKNVMAVADARRICPDIILVPQSPDLYRRAISRQGRSEDMTAILGEGRVEQAPPVRMGITK